MVEKVVEVEPRRMRWIEHQLSDARVLSAINIEVEQATGVASVVWAERTPADVRKVAVVGFLIETSRLDIALFARYQTEQWRPS